MTITQTFKDQAIFRFREKRDHLAKCFSQLSEEDIWWRPNAASNSIGNIILHLCGNLGQYVLSSLAHQPDVRERDLEFSITNGHDRDALQQKIEAVLDQVCEVVQACPEPELLRERQVQGFTFTGLGVVLHAVEHLSYHTGQVAYIVKLRKDRQVGLYDDFDLNVKNEN